MCQCAANLKPAQRAMLHGSDPGRAGRTLVGPGRAQTGKMTLVSLLQKSILEHGLWQGHDASSSISGEPDSARPGQARGAAGRGARGANCGRGRVPATRRARASPGDTHSDC